MSLAYQWPGVEEAGVLAHVSPAGKASCSDIAAGQRAETEPLAALKFNKPPARVLVRVIVLEGS